jgi:glycine/D-amino acid oxidase-like deaminating enzyme
MDSDHGEQAWVDVNAARVSDALNSPEVRAALYRLLGGEVDPERRREALAREVARLRLRWRPGS